MKKSLHLIEASNSHLSGKIYLREDSSTCRQGLLAGYVSSLDLFSHLPNEGLMLLEMERNLVLTGPIVWRSLTVQTVIKESLEFV